MQDDSFYLISFKSDRFSLPLHDATDISDGHKATIIIGANGSGKSTALAAVIDELTALYTIIHPTTSAIRIYRDVRKGRSELKYRLNGKVYHVLREGTSVRVYEDGKEFRESLRNLPFPSRAIAVAHLPADRFKFSRNREHDFYWYLGLRQATNLTTTGALEAKVIASLLNNFSRTGYREALNEWSKVLEIDGQLWLDFRNLQVDALHVRRIADLDTAGSRIRTGLAEDYFSNQGSDMLRAGGEPALANFFLNLERFATPRPSTGARQKSNRISVEIPFDALQQFEGPNAMPLADGIEVVRKFRLAEEVRLIISKKGVPTPFAELSSGERQILGTVARLLESARDGSIIAIDEPEVSLHPAWQLKYIPTLFRALRHLRSTHVLIATHSHFLVSYADGVTTSLVVAGSSSDSDAGKRPLIKNQQAEVSETIKLETVEAPKNSPWEFEVFDGPVEGRTPENILYRVFGVGTATSFYVEQDLAQALQMISGSLPMNLNTLNTLRQRLGRVSAPDNPAFVEILNAIDGQLERGQNA